jgi:hypothetical protein
LSSWKGKLHSSGGGLCLLTRCFRAYLCSWCPSSKYLKVCWRSLTVIDLVFFWQCDEHKKTYRLARWSILCKPKSVGGLGIIDLEVQNKCLFSKWLFKLLNEDGLW